MVEVGVIGYLRGEELKNPYKGEDTTNEQGRWPNKKIGTMVENTNCVFLINYYNHCTNFALYGKHYDNSQLSRGEICEANFIHPCKWCKSG